MGTERGSATVIMLSVVLLALLLLTAVATVGRVAITRARVSAAADLAALAGAAGGGCEQAVRTALANGVDLADCQVEGGDVLVTAVEEIALAGRVLTVSIRSRAGV